MTSDEFRTDAQLLFGASRGWQTRLSVALGLDRATVSRYLSGTVQVPGPVEAALKCWKDKGRKAE